MVKINQKTLKATQEPSTTSKLLINKLEKQTEMINKVSKKECMDAIEFLHTQGFVEEMTTDKQFYVEVLLKKVANGYNLNLGLDI